MLKKTRRILFYIFVLLFLLIGYGTVLFALGYRYDFVQNKFFKTGSLEIKSNVSANIYINDELAGSTSFLTNSFSKGRLLPRTYRVRAERENYQYWQKLVKIEAGFLTSFPRVVLVLQDFDEETIASASISAISIRKFDTNNGLAVFGNKQKTETINLKTGLKKSLKQLENKSALAQQETAVNSLLSYDGEKDMWFTEHEVWVRWTKDSAYQPLRKTDDIELVTRFSQKIEDVQWYKDSNHLIVSVGDILKFVEIDDRGGINIFDISNVGSPFYYYRDQDAIFKFEGNKLIRINFSR